MNTRFVFAVLFVLIFAIFATPAGAATTGRENGCHTYNLFGHQDRQVNGVDAAFCGQSIRATLTQIVDSLTVTATPPTVVPSTTPTVIVTTTQVPPTIEPTDPPTQEPTVIVETPRPPQETPVPPTEATKKPKCNKGEGNGGESCDPGNNPDNGNDDEN